MVLPKCVTADHRQPEPTDSSRQFLQDSTNWRGRTSQSSAANTDNLSSTAGQQQLLPASRCRAACAARLSRRRAVRPSHLTALCAARRAAAAEAAAEAAAAAAIAAEQRAAAAEQHRQDRAAVAEQRRQDRARAATLDNLGRQQLDSFEEEVLQHSKLQKLTDLRTQRLSIGLMRYMCGCCGAKHFLCEKTGGTMCSATAATRARFSCHPSDATHLAGKGC